jgi:PAS domain S-box-containing protein
MRLQKYLTSAGKYRLTLIGMLLGILAWVVEAFMHSEFFYSNRQNFISYLLLPDLHELWMRLIITTLFISFGIYAEHNIRALRRAEMEIKQVNKELSQIFDTAADGMRVIDCDFNVLRANTTFLKLAKVSRQKIEGLKCHEVFYGASCNTDACPMLRIQQGEERIEYDATKIRQDGGEVPCIVTVTPFRNGNGDLIGIVENFKDISDRKLAEKELQRSHQQLRKVSSHLEMAREQERRAMAREIHDELGQALTCLKMDLHWLNRHLDSQDEAIYHKIEEIDRQLNNTVHEVQRLSSELRPRLLDDLGLSAAMEWHANSVHERLGIAIDVVSIPEDISLSDSLNITIFRIFQEALTNIARHAQASQVEVALIMEPAVIGLTIKDNGRGLSREQLESSNSFGLIGMKERSGLIGGILTIDSVENQGTVVSLTIPIMQEEV